MPKVWWRQLCQSLSFGEKMNCLIKHSQSFIIESVVKRLIEDVNEYSYLLTTEDWRLLMSLDKSVGERKVGNKCVIESVESQ